MSARRVYSDEALRIGLVTGSIRRTSCASRPMPMRAIWPISFRPSAISVIKRQLYDVPFQTLAEKRPSTQSPSEMQVALKGSDFREGVASSWRSGPPRLRGSEGDWTYGSCLAGARLRPRATPGTTLRLSGYTRLRHA